MSRVLAAYILDLVDFPSQEHWFQACFHQRHSGKLEKMNLLTFNKQISFSYPKELAVEFDLEHCMHCFQKPEAKEANWNT